MQHAGLPCPSPTPRACSNSSPPSRWCHPNISSSAVPLSSCQSFLYFKFTYSNKLLAPSRPILFHRVTFFSCLHLAPYKMTLFFSIITTFFTCLPLWSLSLTFLHVGWNPKPNYIQNTDLFAYPSKEVNLTWKTSQHYTSLPYSNYKTMGFKRVFSTIQQEHCVFLVNFPSKSLRWTFSTSYLLKYLPISPTSPISAQFRDALLFSLKGRGTGFLFLT